MFTRSIRFAFFFRRILLSPNSSFPL
uniref:Uncharacterized protein n=1 Tax=Arabidopsis thaliana TaxID=3702 RepID=Q570P0_ARATH|nr:hypothetical protein [Arabidopsis thaliana]BAE99070.1 hypothetical protein [Arabidopsis thaliana]